jgi:phosphatidylserine/phosphatidylglycerophosphate/cardiolipin synthase-like enzyme
MVEFIGPYFSKPTLLKEEVIPDFSLYVELQKLFSKIPNNATIRSAIYMWNNSYGIKKKGFKDKWKNETGNPHELTQTFIKRARNCDTKIIFDNYNEQKHSDLIKNLSISLGSKNIIIDPRNNQMSDPEFRQDMAKAEILAKSGYMHDKFFLISELEGIGKHVIIQMTANINITQTHQFNNMIIIYNDQNIYSKYMLHWNDLKYNIEKIEEDEYSNVFKNENPYVLPEIPITVFFMPRNKCPIETEFSEILKNAGQRTKIDIAMTYLTRPKIRSLILKLKQKKCKIRILLSEEFQNKKNTIPIFENSKIPLKIIANKCYNNEAYLLNDKIKSRDNWCGRMHHKFVLIEHDQNQIVWTGSYNLTHPGLRYNDETVLRINDPQVYRKYKHHFNILFKTNKSLKRILYN